MPKVLTVLDPLGGTLEKISHRSMRQLLNSSQHPLVMLQMFRLHQLSCPHQASHSLSRHWRRFLFGHLVLVHEMTSKPNIGQRLQPNLAAARHQGWEEHLRIQRQQYKDMIARRFLKDLEQGVSGFFPEAVGILHDDHPLEPLERPKSELPLDGPNLFNLDKLAIRGNGHDIGMKTPLNLATTTAHVATVAIVRIVAVDQLGEFHGQGCFLDPGHTSEE